jgi:hypothetical protein
MEARYPGDPRGRPARAFCAVSATGSIRRWRDELIDKAVVCSFDGNSHEVDTIRRRYAEGEVQPTPRSVSTSQALS